MIMKGQNSLFILKSNKKLLSVGRFLYISTIYEKNPLTVINLVTPQYQVLLNFLFFLFQGNYKAKD